MKQFVINVTPGPTFLHHLSGKTKVMLFGAFIFYTLMSFDVRLLFTSTNDLRDLVGQNLFRDDLYHLINQQVRME